ncbi:hypothetical protein [Azotobacter beijerinckii]|nr:hypothetical protein [Azotobacter beijerinckii]
MNKPKVSASIFETGGKGYGMVAFFCAGNLTKQKSDYTEGAQ